MYKVFVLSKAQKDLNAFPVRIFKQIKSKILIITKNPRPSGCLKLTAEEGYRLRAGNYRILYRIDDTKKIIYIYRIKHRKEAYR